MDARLAAHPALLAWAVPSDDVITADNRHVEVTWRWRGALRAVLRARDVGELMIGAGTGLPIPLPGGGARPLVTSTKTGAVVHAGPDVTATLRRRGGDAATAVIGSITLTDDVVVELELGAHRLEIHTVARTRAVLLPPLFDALWANTALLAVCVVALLLGTTLFFPVGMDDLDDVLATHPTRVSSVLLRATPRPIPAPTPATASDP